MSWDEIRRLASDFQRIQSGAAAKKLSDRNCVEIILKLRNEKRINVVYTIDGKEFVTKDHLKRQIENEVLGSGGRVALTTLQEVISVEYQHVEDMVHEILREASDDYILLLGQLMSTNYVDGMVKDVADWLHEEGRLTIGEVAKKYDLPFDFVLARLTEGMNDGRICAIVDKNDSQVLYTEAHVARQQNVLRGALSAACTPLPISKVVQEAKLQPSLVFQCFDRLLESGIIQGELSGGKQIDRAIFIPEAYKKALSAYAADSLRQSGYIDNSTLRKLGWSFGGSALLDTDTRQGTIDLECGTATLELWKELQGKVVEFLQENAWVDALSFLPNQFATLPNAESLLKAALAGKEKNYGIIGAHCAYANAVLEEILPLFTEEIESKAAAIGPELVKAMKKAPGKATEAVEEEDWNDNKKKKGKGKKKKGGGGDGKSVEPAKPVPSAEFMPLEDIADFLGENWNPECDQQILEHLSEEIKPSLDAKFREKVESVFLSANSVNKEAMKQAQSEFEALFKSLAHKVYMFDAGCDTFPPNIADQLREYILRSLCSEIVNIVVTYASGLPPDSKISQKARDDLVAGLPSDVANQIKTLVQEVSKKGEMQAFLESLEDISRSDIIAVPVKMPDKRSRQEILTAYSEQLQDQLRSTASPPECLLLALILLLTKTHAVMVHASGKFVPQLVSALIPKLDNDDLSEQIRSVKDMVVQKLSSKRFSQEAELDTALESLRNEVLSFVRS